jgi:hypothetical protein
MINEELNLNLEIYGAKNDTYSPIDGKNTIFRIRYDIENINSLSSNLSGYAKAKFLVENINNFLYLNGYFYDKNGNEFKKIEYLLSGNNIYGMYSYFKSTPGIGIRIETSNLSFLFSDYSEYESIYYNGWYYICASNGSSGAISYRSAFLGSSTFDSSLYYDMFYTVSDIDSQTYLPNEFKNSIGGYLSSGYVFGNSFLRENVYPDSINASVDDHGISDGIQQGDIIEISINEEIMSLEFIKNDQDNNLSFFKIIERGLYSTPIQGHIINSKVKRSDRTDIFNFTFDESGQYFTQYRCIGLNIIAQQGDFVCSNISARFSWEPSPYYTYDFGFEIPMFERVVSSNISGNNFSINLNPLLTDLLLSRYNSDSVFSPSLLIGMPIVVNSTDGSSHKRYISSYNLSTNQIIFNEPLPFSISSNDQIVFGPSPSRSSIKGISMDEGQDARFSGFLGVVRFQTIGSLQNISIPIPPIFSERYSSTIRSMDTIYIWIKRVVKNNNIINFDQRLFMNFDCEVN